MRRIDSSFPFAALAVLVAITACSKAADKAAADAKKPDTSAAVATKPVDAKAPDAKAPGAKAPDTKTAGANAASKTGGVKIVAAAPASDAPPVPVKGGQIDPGMSKAQVIALLGTPASDRVRGDFTYLLFANGMETQVGMNDLVVLEGDKVVDAVLRAPNRSYSGTSSSPRPIPATEAAKAKPPVPPKGGT